MSERSVVRSRYVNFAPSKTSIGNPLRVTVGLVASHQSFDGKTTRGKIKISRWGQRRDTTASISGIRSFVRTNRFLDHSKCPTENPMRATGIHVVAAIKAGRLDSDSGRVRAARGPEKSARRERTGGLVKEEEEEEEAKAERRARIDGEGRGERKKEEEPYGRRHAVGYIGFAFPPQPSTAQHNTFTHTHTHARVRASASERPISRNAA